MADTKNAQQVYENLEGRIRDEILTLFESVIAGKPQPFRNSRLSRCWDAIDSDPCQCLAAIEGQDQQEFSLDIAGFNQLDKGDPRPYEACTRCPVYTAVCPTIVEELGEAFNTMVHILIQKDDVISNAATLTRELASSLEDMGLENRIIRERMITDTLTSLYNRHYLNECLTREVERCQNRKRSLSVVMFDLDDFKDFNDTYGHLEGDKVLAATGKHLRCSIREYDKAFRFGGEEFLVLLPDTNIGDAILVAERIRMHFNELRFEPPTSGGRPLKQESLTLSGGLATYQQDMGALELLESADQALYEAKRLGKNRIEIQPTLIPT